MSSGWEELKSQKGPLSWMLGQDWIVILALKCPGMLIGEWGRSGGLVEELKIERPFYSFYLPLFFLFSLEPILLWIDALRRRRNPPIWSVSCDWIR